MKKYFFYSLLFLGFLSACNPDVPQEDSNPNTTTASTIDSSSFDYFLLRYAQAQPAEVIAPALAEQYIRPALAAFPFHPYLAPSIATYSYGQVAYENDAIAVLTFYYKAAHDKNLLAASFIASYDKRNAQFIDSKMVFGSSTFNLIKQIGYNIGLSYKSELEYLSDSSEVILKLHSTEERLYGQFQEGVPKKEKSTRKLTFNLLQDGRFEESSSPVN